MESGRRPCFSISTGRSGSTMLAQVVACHPRTISFHEPSPELCTENLLAWRGRISDDRLHHQISKKRDWLLRAANKNGLLFFEASPFLIQLVKPLYEIYRPRFIYLYRDGRDYARSGLTRSWYERVDTRTYLARILRHWTLKPFGNPFEDGWLVPPKEAKTRFEKIAWLWNEKNTRIQSQLQQVPQEDVFRLKLESFGHQTIQKLLDFLELEVTSALVETMVEVAETRPNKTKGEYSIPPKQDWRDRRMDRFMHFAGEQMHILGYLKSHGDHSAAAPH